MCILIPIPGTIAKLSHDVQVNKMKKVSRPLAFMSLGGANLLTCRVMPGSKLCLKVSISRSSSLRTDKCTSTIVMSGAIRMVKMFGWESRMSARIDEKRKEELQLLRKYSIINAIVSLMK